MRYRTLGAGLEVSAIGIGCMPMVQGGNIVYGGGANPDDAIETMAATVIATDYKVFVGALRKDKAEGGGETKVEKVASNAHLRHMRAIIEGLASPPAEGDHEVARRSVHALKGSAGLAGEPELASTMQAASST